MAAQPRTPPELIDGDVIGEILVRIPPDESAYLARTSLVCKRWRRILSDPGFTRSYREFHRTPPLLGFLHNSESGRLFFPTTAACPFPLPAAFECSRWWTLDYRRLWALDCRHGRVLLRYKDTANLLVWDPIAGDREELHKPHIPYVFSSAMVLCAAAGCDHRECLSGPFLVVFVGVHGGSAHGCVYSSEARAWGSPASVYLGGGYFVDLKRGTLVGDDAYFVVRDGATIVKYDLGNNCLSAIDPPDGFGRNIIVMPADDGSLGLAGIRGSKLYLWSRKVNPKEVPAKWVQCRVMELKKLFPVNFCCNRARVIGFAEGVGVMFVRIDISTFMIELKSGQVRKVREFGEFDNVLPFMSFYAPGSACTVLPLSAEKK